MPVARAWIRYFAPGWLVVDKVYHLYTHTPFWFAVLPAPPPPSPTPHACGVFDAFHANPRRALIPLPTHAYTYTPHLYPTHTATFTPTFTALNNLNSRSVCIIGCRLFVYVLPDYRCRCSFGYLRVTFRRCQRATLPATGG